MPAPFTGRLCRPGSLGGYAGPVHWAGIARGPATGRVCLRLLGLSRKGRCGGRLLGEWHNAAPAERYSAKAFLDAARGTQPHRPNIRNAGGPATVPASVILPAFPGLIFEVPAQTPVRPGAGTVTRRTAEPGPRLAHPAGPAPRGLPGAFSGLLTGRSVPVGTGAPAGAPPASQQTQRLSRPRSSPTLKLRYGANREKPGQPGAADG